MFVPMTPAEPANPYARQRALIEELITRCHGAAIKHADDLDAAETAEDRELPTRGLDRMFRAVRVGTDALVRLDRGAAETRERLQAEDRQARIRQGRVDLKRLLL